MSPDTDLPVLGKVAAYARLYPDRVKLDLVAGTIIDCGKRIREEYVPAGLFQRRDLPGAGLAHRGEEDAGAGDGRAGRRPAGAIAAGNFPT